MLPWSAAPLLLLPLLLPLPLPLPLPLLPPPGLGAVCTPALADFSLFDGNGIGGVSVGCCASDGNGATVVTGMRPPLALGIGPGSRLCVGMQCTICACVQRWRREVT